MIPYGRQKISDADKNAVMKVLESDFLTQGPIVPKFEQALSNYTKAKYCICVNSATSALHASCYALGVNNSSRVWTSVNTFVASANCAAVLGATISLLDIDPADGNISIDLLERKLKTTAPDQMPTHLIAVHFSGQSCDMKRIFSLSKQYSFYIIEDASHALGADYLDTKVGSCQYSDVAIFSFHPVKMITSAEGGCALTNKKDIAEKIRLYASHGVVRKPYDNEPWYYESSFPALNYRMSEIHAALGLSQLVNIDVWVEGRRALVRQYKEKLAGLGIEFLIENNYGKSSYHILVIKLPINIDRSLVYQELIGDGVGVQVHYIPMYRHTQYSSTPLVNMEGYYQRCLTIPLYPHLTENEFDNVCVAMNKAIINKANRL
jgi:UDP-4-amino-4,6-dideoxy-N-acetyl-beta-L-altrosamine transaminase